MNALSPFIGIDFGTTNSRMAWYNPKTNQAEILRNAEGEEQTPSVAYFGESETLVGSPAESMLEYEQERERIIISIKRELVTTPVIALPSRLVKPVEVAAEILHKLKQDAEEQHFLQEITRAVITCPASFGRLERDKIREAAQLAGFGEVELLEEPVAAAIAYTQMGFKVGKYVLVYDLGGGTFDLAVLAREDDGLFHPALEPQGIKRCGGDNFDEALYNFCDGIAREKLDRPISLTGKRDLHFLSECRQRKEILSNSERRMFKSLLEPGAVLFQHEIDRMTFESLISPTVEETVRNTVALLEQANAKGYGVDTFVLVGGSTRVPLTQRLLNTSLPSKVIPWHHRDVAVALGAAYHAYSLWRPENQYRKAVALTWTDKNLDEIKIAQLTTLANDLGLTEQQVTDLERAIMGGAKEEIFSHQRALEQYHKAVEGAWSDKKLNRQKIERLTALTIELALSKERVAQIERRVMGDAKETIFESQKREQYLEAVQSAWSGKQLDQAKLERLTALAKKLELSEEQVAQIEREVMGQVKEVLFTPRIVPQSVPPKVLGEEEWLGNNPWSEREFKLPPTPSTNFPSALPGAAELEAFITMKGDDPAHDYTVRRRVVKAHLLALGEVGQDGLAHLLHCTVPVGAMTIAMLPVFTRVEHVATAVQMNPKWQSLQVIEVDGQVLLGDLDEEEWLGINPWSGREYKLPWFPLEFELTRKAIADYDRALQLDPKHATAYNNPYEALPATITPTMVFDDINGRIQANPAQSAGINATYKFVLSGSGGGYYFIALADGTGEAGQGIVDNPDITISMTSNDFVDMATGKLDGTMAFMSGKIKMEGNMDLAMVLQKVLG